MGGLATGLYCPPPPPPFPANETQPTPDDGTWSASGWDTQTISCRVQPDRATTARCSAQPAAGLRLQYRSVVPIKRQAHKAEVMATHANSHAPYGAPPVLQGAQDRLEYVFPARRSPPLAPTFTLRVVVSTSQAWGIRDDRIPGTDQAVRGGRHGQKLHSGVPPPLPRQGDARSSADARLS